MSKLKSAVIGVGKAGGGGPKGGGHAIGATHALMFQSHPDVELIAGADINAENLKHFQEQFKVPHGYASYIDMIRELKPDLVSIGTYVGLHREMIENAARAGVKSILCEKPFVASIPQLNAVKRVVEETGVKLLIAHVRRYRPVFIKARQLISSGAIGQPILFTAGIEGWDLSEWGSHWLDIFRFLNEDRPITWVMGQARVRDWRGYGHAMEEQAMAYFSFDKGVRGILDGGKALAGKVQMLLSGSDGSIRIEGEKRCILINANGQQIFDFSNEPSSDWQSVWVSAMQDWVNWLRGGEMSQLAFQRTWQSAELNLAAYISMIRGDRVDLPVQDETDEWPVEELARRAKK